MKSCTRESSLDSDVVESSIVANAFPSFLRAAPTHRERSAFNGAKAEQSFQRYALPKLGAFRDPRLLPACPRRAPRTRRSRSRRSSPLGAP
jgi:hypothetical protein